jgi:hypothetical protein
LLVEPSAQNAFIESQTLFTTHLVQNLTTSGYTNATASPDGSVTAEKFVPNTTNGVHGIANGSSLAITSGTTYTFSLFVKSDGGPHNLISLTFDSTTAWGATRNCIFNASNGTNFAVPTGATMTSENYGNGWYRIRATLTAVGTAAAALYQYRIYITDASGNLSWAAPSGNTNGIFCWGAQLETGSVATSYIPTTAGTGSRSGDLVSVTGAVSGSIGQTAGTFYLDLTYSLRLTSTATRWIQIFGSSNNIGLAVATTNIVRSIVNGQSDILSTPSTSGGVKIAWGYDGSGVVCFVNGTQYTLTNGGAQIITQLNQISLDLSTTTAIGNCRLRAMALYTNRLTNAELALITQP